MSIVNRIGDFAGGSDIASAETVNRPNAGNVFLAELSSSDAATTAPLEVRINLFVAVISILVLAGTTLGLTFLHARQMSIVAESLRTKGAGLHLAGDLPEAYRTLRQYAAYVPQDQDAQIEIARIAGKMFRSTHDERVAVSAYEKVLRTVTDADLSPLRLELVDILLESGRVATAIEHLKLVEKSSGDNDQVQSKLGFCYEAQHEYEKASHAYQQAIRIKPGNFRYWFELARIEAERLGHPAEAQALMDRLVAENRRVPDAYAIRGQIRLLQGDLAGAILDGRTAYRLDRSSREVLLLVVELLAAGSARYEAASWFDPAQVRRDLEQQQATTKEDDISLTLSLAKLDMVDKDFESAIQRLKLGSDKYPDRVDLIWLLIDFLTVENRTDEARQVLKTLEERRIRSFIVEYLRARIEMSEKHWVEAARILEGLKSVQEKPSFFEDVYLNLGKCHSQMGLTHLAILDLEEALRLNPSLFEPRLFLADILADRGRFAEAVHFCVPIARTSLGALAIAKLQVLASSQYSKDVTLRDVAERAINAAAAFPENHDEARYLRFKLLLAVNELAKASELLDQLSVNSSEQSRVDLARVDLMSATGEYNSALEHLEQLKSTHGVSGQLMRAYLKLHGDHPDSTTIDCLLKLSEEARQLSGPERWEILGELATNLDRLQAIDEASFTWKEIAEATSSSTAWRRVFEHALQRQENAELEQVLQMIEEVEGGHGVQWHLCSALKLFAQLDEKPDLRIQLREHLREAVKNAATDATFVRQVAELAQRAGLIDDAISYYRGALSDLPGQDPDFQVLKSLVDLLMKQRRYREAHQEISRFLQDRQFVLPREFRQQAATLSLLSDRRLETLNIAKELLHEGSNDYRDHLWLGRLLSAAGDTANARSCFERATQLAPEEYVTWVEYLQFLYNSKHFSQIDGVFKQATSKIPENSQTRFLAEANEAVGNLADALDYSEQSVAQDPENVSLLMDHASRLMRSFQFAKCEAVLRKILGEGAPDSTVRSVAAKSLALVLAQRGEFPAHSEALQLVSDAKQFSLNHGGIGFEEDLVLAQIQGKFSLRESKLVSAAIFSELQAKGYHIPDDARMIWAQVYLDLGQWDNAYWTMSPLLTSSNPHPFYLTKCVYEMLEHEEIGEGTQVWIDRLKQLVPEAEATIQLEALHLTLTGHAADAVNCVNRWTNDSDLQGSTADARQLAAPEILAQLTTLARRHGRTVEAQQIQEAAIAEFKRNISAGNHEQAIELALLYADDVRTTEALDVLDSAANKISLSDLGQVYLRLITSGGRSPDVLRRVSTLIDSADIQSADDETLEVVANLAHAAGDFDRAITLYREFASRSSVSLYSLNELAFLLALTGRSGGQEHIDRAIEKYGPRGFLLDTSALILLKSGNAEQALQTSQAAVADQALPEHLFRKVQADIALGQLEDARDTWRQAISKGLHANRLHPLERSEFTRIESLIEESSTTRDNT